MFPIATSPVHNDIAAVLDMIELNGTGEELIEPAVIHPSANVEYASKQLCIANPKGANLSFTGNCIQS